MAKCDVWAGSVTYARVSPAIYAAALTSCVVAVGWSVLAPLSVGWSADLVFRVQVCGLFGAREITWGGGTVRQRKQASIHRKDVPRGRYDLAGPGLLVFAARADICVVLC